MMIKLSSLGVILVTLFVLISSSLIGSVVALEENNTPNEKSSNGVLVLDDLLCPLTKELPVDPVVAEDGRIYERSAIEDHIQNNKKEGGELISPITQERMGEKLTALPQIRTHIESLISTDNMVGDNLKEKHKKYNLNKNKEDLIKKAENGDAIAMFDVAHKHSLGEDGFAKDDGKSLFWLEKSHQAGHIPATYDVAIHLLRGWGVHKNEALGMLYLGMAAQGGSDVAAYRLGKAFAVGLFGLGVNTGEAIKWLKVALSGECKFKRMGEGGKQSAQELLKLLDKLTTSDV